MEARKVVEQFRRGKVVVEVWLFRKVADLPVHLDIADRFPEDPRGPGGREDQSHEELYRGRLSGAVRSKKAERLSGLHLHGQPFERPFRLQVQEAERIILRQILRLNGRRGHDFIFLKEPLRVNWLCTEGKY